MAYRLDLALAPDKFRELPCCCTLESRAQWSEPSYLIYINWLGDALDLSRTQRLEGEITFAQSLRPFRRGNRSDWGQRLHPRR
jgi:hypothetical protein